MVEKIETKRLEQTGEKKIITLGTTAPKKKLRVAAYARVSTEMEDQNGSIAIQREHFRQMIADHPEWKFVGIYGERESGTHVESRKELGQLLNVCRKGKVDLVLVKSVSRLARNVAELLKITRELVDLGVDLIFEKENIDTRNGNGELILTLFATVAEEEVHSISENNRWAIIKRFQDGTYRFPNAPYGYELSDGGFVVNPEEAEIVKKIYDDYLNGKGLGKIAGELNAAGVPLKRQGQYWKQYDGRWTRSTVSGILHNDTYLGNSLLQKTYYDYHFKRQKNQGERNQYLWEDHHEALIDEGTHQKAEQLLKLRVEESHQKEVREKSIFSGKLICSECGSVLHREEDHRKTKDRVYWNCPGQRRQPRTCQMKRVLEDDLKNAFRTMMNKLHFADEILEIYQKEVMEEWRDRQGVVLPRLEKKIEEAKKNYDRLISNRDWSVFSITQKQEMEWELLCLQERYRNLDPPDLEPTREFREFVLGWKDQEFPEKAFSQYVDHVEILTPQRFRFHLVCGLELEEGKE